MQQFIIYIIPVAVVLTLVIGGMIGTRRAISRYTKQTPPPVGLFPNETPKQELVDNRPYFKIYERPDVEQRSYHPMGAVQSVIRGRIRFVVYGLLLFAAGLFCLYLFFRTDLLAEYSSTLFYRIGMTVTLIGTCVYGLRMMSYATYRVRLRRTGFEIASIFGTKAYEYNEADFALQRTMAARKIRTDSGTTTNYRWVWLCWIRFHDGRKPIVLKSTRYAQLRYKIQNLIDSLTAVR